MSDRDQTPCYVASCPECQQVVAVTVAEIDDPRRMREALKYRAEWERAGLLVHTMTAETFRENGKFGHFDTCVRGQQARTRGEVAARREERRQAR